MQSSHTGRGVDMAKVAAASGFVARTVASLDEVEALRR